MAPQAPHLIFVTTATTGGGVLFSSRRTFLNRERGRYANQNTKYANQNTKYAKQNTKYAKQNTKYANQNTKYVNQNTIGKAAINRIFKGDRFFSC